MENSGRSGSLWFNSKNGESLAPFSFLLLLPLHGAHPAFLICVTCLWCLFCKRAVTDCHWALLFTACTYHCVFSP